MRKNLGEEDISMLDPSDFYCNFGKGVQGFINMVQKVNYNEKYPQNHNIMITSQYDSYCLVYNEGEWQQMLRKDVVARLLVRHFKWMDAFNKIYKDYIDSHQINNYIQLRQETTTTSKNLKHLTSPLIEMAIKHKKLIQESAKQSKKIKQNIKAIAKEMVIDSPTPVF
jgi:hypothetical protein